MGWEIAQANFALPTVPLNEPELAWFVDALDSVNAKADAAPGFRWRFKPRRWRPTIVRAFGDGLIVNLSVWASVEELADFVYRHPAHAAVLRRRDDGFRRLGEAHQVLWWVPAGHRPSIADAVERLAHLREHGPTEWAFTFAARFPDPGDHFTQIGDTGRSAG